MLGQLGSTLLILHLSDIHFRKMEIETAQDPNFHLRNELLRDIVGQCKTLGPPDLIVISGDIAFAGHPDEFAFATDWLGELCEACGGSLDKVFVCPGNHDVVRTQADKNMVQNIHRNIKTAENPTQFIFEQLRDPDAAKLLYESLDNFNAFAFQFFCDLLPPERTRAKRDVVLNDGSLLRLWGINTTFVSSSHDVRGSLFVDSASFQIPRETGVVNLVMAHHDLTWIRQSQELADHLNDVAQIQMFGHVHTNRINREVDYLRLTASAVHPEKNEPGWEPGYNLLELCVDGVENARLLKLKAHVRVWQTAPGGFRAKQIKGKDIWKHEIPLEEWHPSPIAIENAGQRPKNGQTILQSDGVGALPVKGFEMNQLRDVGLRFYRLSFSKKSEIAGRLDLLEEDDMKQPDFERFRRAFFRAHERGILEQLAKAVFEAEQN
ncbi:metallophosphoesterase [Rhodoferax sp. GW822-FHT02A01]|uniref:metallophosphoesterase n=1 Tax=Rhodoferax sp. GW822-FHT02A01 TaxID=3141537 RepID=UPI00315DED9F